MPMLARSAFKTLAAAVLAVAIATVPAVADDYRVLHSFADDGTGKHPWTEVIRTPDGKLFGTTTEGGEAGFGTIFMLEPPAAANGEWTRTALHEFRGNADGRTPLSGLVRGKDGRLFGATEAGGGGTCSGGCGTVYELTPKPAGGFAYRTIHRFASPNGGARASGRLAYKAGKLYGTTSAGGRFGGGVVYELRPVGSGWRKTILHAFRGGRNDGFIPRSGVVFGPDGALYGTTESGGKDTGAVGTVFRVAPSKTKGWRSTLLHRFKGGVDGAGPIAPVVVSPEGTVFGTAPYGGRGACFLRCGVVFAIEKAGNRWTQSVIYRFGGPGDGSFPRGSLVLDSGGRLYGTTSAGGGPVGGGTLWRLDPPDATENWKTAVLRRFAGPPTEGLIPFGGLVESGGTLYGTTRDGGVGSGGGTVFSYRP